MRTNLSLTPRFSGVCRARPNATTASAVYPGCGKLLKQLPVPPSPLSTLLKQGVNEIGSSRVLPGYEISGLALDPDISSPRTHTGEPTSSTPCFSKGLVASQAALTASAVCSREGETAEAVAALGRARHTPLKRDVHESFVVLPIRLMKDAG